MINTGETLMVERYASREEYKNLFTTLKRKETAEKIHVKGKTLDIATGPSYFAIQVAKTHTETTITGIDIFEGSIKTARKNIKKEGLQDRIKIIQMDATDLQFMDESFDIAINYLGLEDIHMTRGRKGVVQAFREIHRVLKPGGSFYFVVIPVGRLDTWAQRLEAEVFNWICGAKWLHHNEYLQILEETGFKLVGSHDFYTGLKLEVEQAKEEISYACRNVEKNYGINTPSFDETWCKFRERIEKHGMGHYSKTCLIKSRKKG